MNGSHIYDEESELYTLEEEDDDDYPEKVRANRSLRAGRKK